MKQQILKYDSDLAINYIPKKYYEKTNWLRKVDTEATNINGIEYYQLNRTHIEELRSWGYYYIIKRNEDNYRFISYLLEVLTEAYKGMLPHINPIYLQQKTIAFYRYENKKYDFKEIE